jgi:PTS system mannose-specific IID component
MQGVGLGAVTAPLLEPLQNDPERLRQARGRSVEHFNAHPFLAGAAAGALARAELDGESAERVRRLRAALSGPLGSLGDQLIWAGLVPAVMGASLALMALGAGRAVLAALVTAFIAFRVALAAWGLRLGLANGIQVAAAIGATPLAQAAARAGDLGALLLGLALPLVAIWLVEGTGHSLRIALAAGLGAVLYGLATLRRPLPAPLLTIGAVSLTLIWRWSAA